MYLLSNQIAVFFDQQYLWTKTIGISGFLHEDKHQGKVASETFTFRWVWTFAHLFQSYC